MTRFLLLGLPLLLVCLTLLRDASGASSLKFFDFKDPKQMNAVSLSIDAPWEPVVGYADGITGGAIFDPEKPEATTGKIVLDVSSVRFSNEGYTQTARFYALEEKKYPQILCELKKIKSGKIVRTGVYEGMVEVDFTCHGVTRPLTVPITVSYLPGASKKRFPDFEGDLLVVRCNFAIRRSDFGIAKSVETELVSDEIGVRVAIVGTEKPLPAPPTVAIVRDSQTYSLAERQAFYHVPGVSVAVIKDFSVTWVGHYGEASAGKPVSDNTLYSVGAMSQPLVAAAVLKAVENGQLALDTDIQDYLRTWKVPQSTILPNGRGITLRDVLTHRSGFTGEKYSGYLPTGPIPTLMDILNVMKPTQKPGTQFQLSMENLTLLQQILMDQTGEPFDTLMRNRAFKPLAMPQSTFAQPLPASLHDAAAVGHAESGEALPYGWRVYPEVAASGLWTTPREFAGCLAELLRCAAGRDGTFLKREMAKLLVEPITGTGDSPQAIGFGLDSRGGVSYLYKGGNTDGYYCHLDADLEKGNAVIVFTNGNLCWRLANEIRDSVAHAEGFRGF